jgi:hypothetical protein
MYTYLSTNWLQENDATCGGSIKISISLTRGGSAERSNMWREVPTTKNTQYTFHHLALFVTDTNVYVKDILLSTEPPLVRDILIFSDPPHNPPKLSFRAKGHTKSQGAVLPNSMKKGKNLERLITATSQAHI